MKTTSILAAILAVFLMFAATPASADEGVKQKAVLVTGASTGIGRNLAERLAAEGYFVYAGARKDKDLEELDAIENVKAVRLDVTSDEDIAAAVELVKSEGRGLWGLVNNAGVASSKPLHHATYEDLHWTFRVNVAGVMRVTTAFAPLVIEEQGRISTTGSIAGIRSGPGMGVYSMSKHAMEAYTDSLAADMADTGVFVSIVEPGSYKSRIRRNAVAAMQKQIEAAGGELTEEQKQAFKDLAAREVSLQEPDAVSDAFMHALFSDEPRRRYMVVPNEEQARQIIMVQIRELVQLNDWHAYSYGREELVQMLDEALGAQ